MEVEDRILVMDAYVHNWEDQAASNGCLVYVYQGQNGTWVCRFVPDRGNAAPAAWRGRAGGKLVAECGVGDALFCHRSGYLCVAASQEGAIALARKATAER